MSAILITGAAGDIGNATALALASLSQTLVLCDHPSAASRLHDRAQALRQRGAVVHEQVFDVAHRIEVAQAFDHCVDQGLLPTQVFNNAGYQGTFERVDQMSSDDFAKVLSVNVLGVFNVIAETSARLIAAGLPGAIVNTASMAGVGGAPNMAGYSASKAAVIGLTKTASKDLAQFSIRVNSISPAFIGPGAMWDRQVALQAAAKSPFYSSDPAEVARQMIGKVPLGRYGSLDEVAQVVAFLLSDAASYLTGINVEIAGGAG